MKYFPGHPFIEQIIIEAANFPNIVIDSFCGMGGFTDGFERTGKFKVIACINHWKVAIDTHERNHPMCLHIEEDFRTADLSLIKYMVDKIRQLNPLVKLHGSFGLECTNFSNAKGGMSRNEDSRTLADHVDRYVKTLNFDYIWIENVREFLMWGGMIPKVVLPIIVKGVQRKKAYHFNPDKDDAAVFTDMPGAYCPLHIEKKKKVVTYLGKWMIPDPITKGRDFKRWRKHIESFGYQSDYKLLNAADYGVPQHRIRLILQFTRKGMQASWPLSTHSKKGVNGLPKWNTIGPCLDLEDEGTELLAFKPNKKGELIPRIKSPATIKRLMKGCVRHVFNGEAQFITKYMGNSSTTGDNNGKSIHEPSNALATSNRVGLVSTRLIDYYFGNGYTKPITDVAGVMRTKDPASVNMIQLVSEFRGNGEAATIDSTSKAMVTKDKYSLDTIRFIDQRYSNGKTDSSLNEKSPAMLSNPKQCLVSVKNYIMDTQFNNDAISLDDTSRTITANRKHFYIINAAWFAGHSKPITEPSATIIARQDKTPQYLIVTTTGNLAIEVYPHDPPHYVAFKRFMADYGIVSVKMRMLKDTEMLRIQSFKKETKLTKNASHNKKMIGNAVPPEMVEALANAHSNFVITPIKDTQLSLAV